MVRKTMDYFDIRQICDSGQCFRMVQRDARTYSVIAAGRYLEIEQSGKECMFSCGEEEFEEYWKGYFDLERDYGAYIGAVSVDTLEDCIQHREDLYIPVIIDSHFAVCFHMEAYGEMTVRDRFQIGKVSNFA